MNWRERYEDMIDHWSDAHNLNSCESKDGKKIHNMQGSRLTFPLASPVASDSFDSLAKRNISPARYSFINLLTPVKYQVSFHAKTSYLHADFQTS